jgi:Polysaccharide deacetylase
MPRHSCPGLLAMVLAIFAACSTESGTPTGPGHPGGGDAGPGPGTPPGDLGADGGPGRPEDDGGMPPPPPPPPKTIYDCNWGPPAITSLAPSTSPPGGLAVNNVPQLVAFGFDDNTYEDGMKWALDFIQPKKNPAGRGEHCTFDGTPARFSFYITSHVDQTSDGLKAQHARAYKDGNEVANHTDTHGDELQANSNLSVWRLEMDTCNGYLTGLGVPKADITGFRTPFLQYTQATFNAIVQTGFQYDCSVEHFLSATGEDWPYTLDHGPSKSSYMRNDGTGNHPGLWELPVHELMPATGWAGVTGLDYNVFCVAKMDSARALDLLKASLDLHFKGDSRAPGNRAPLFVGGHTDLYSANNASAASCANTYQERRKVIEQFVDYALQYDPSVRVVPYGQVVRWMQHPIGLDGTKAH